ncbi:unnamed protein product, partial [Owenia fusiformis]
GEMRYRLKGIAPATDFFRIDPNTGKLYVIKPLDTETTPTYTLNVGASNTANPKVEIDTIVTINVIRNVHKPIFSPPERNVTVDDGTPEGEPIVTVTATDADLPVSSEAHINKCVYIEYYIGYMHNMFIHFNSLYCQSFYLDIIKIVVLSCLLV